MGDGAMQVEITSQGTHDTAETNETSTLRAYVHCIAADDASLTASPGRGTSSPSSSSCSPSGPVGSVLINLSNDTAYSVSFDFSSGSPLISGARREWHLTGNGDGMDGLSSR